MQSRNGVFIIDEFAHINPQLIEKSQGTTHFSCLDSEIGYKSHFVGHIMG